MLYSQCHTDQKIIGYLLGIKIKHTFSGLEEIITHQIALQLTNDH